MRLTSRVLVSALSCCLFTLSACDDGEPPPLDSGTDAASDALSDVYVPTRETGSKDTGSVSKDTGTVTSKDAASDRTVTDSGHDAAVDAHKDVEVADTAKPFDAGFCGDSGAQCPSGTTCASGVCTAWGQAAGELCGAASACPSGTTCGAKGYCSPCGGPGEACCVANECNSGGCCVADVCTPSGSVCPYTGGGLCESSNCGNACADGGCSVCGGPGQECCPTVGCTAEAVQCESTGTGSGSGATKVCQACGGAGEACCGTACLGASLVCDPTAAACVLCGGTGEPCCAASDAGLRCNGSLLCSAASLCQ